MNLWGFFSFCFHIRFLCIFKSCLNGDRGIRVVFILDFCVYLNPVWHVSQSILSERQAYIGFMFRDVHHFQDNFQIAKWGGSKNRKKCKMKKNCPINMEIVGGHYQMVSIWTIVRIYRKNLCTSLAGGTKQVKWNRFICIYFVNFFNVLKKKRLQLHALVVVKLTKLTNLF